MSLGLILKSATAIWHANRPRFASSILGSRHDDTNIVSYGPVIQSYADDATADLFAGTNSRAARRAVPKDIWRVVRRKLAVLDAATSLKDLAAVPGDRLEALVGDQAGRYSVRINDQYRITFRFENGHAYEVRCEDYH